MLCPNCGAETPDSSKYCVECGASLKAGDRERPLSAPEHESVSDSSPAEPQNVPDSASADRPQSSWRTGPAVRRRQRRRLVPPSDSAAHAPTASGAPRSASADATAQAMPEEAVQDRLGDTIRYDSAALRRRSAEADAAEPGSDAQPPETDSPADGAEDIASVLAASSAGTDGDTSPSEEPVQPVSTQHSDLPAQEYAEDSESHDEEASSEAHTRTERRRKAKRAKKWLWILAVCAAAVAAIGIWQWSVSTPRARMTQALRNGDIMAACEIYDEELREEGLTANEVYYLCAAAQQVADDFEDDPTGDSYEGRVLLLNRLDELPYRDVQDAVAAARKQLESRNTVVGHVSAAAEAERRGDYITAIEEYEAALVESPDDESLAAEITRLEDAYREHALDTASEYTAAGNIAQARLVLLGAMLEERFTADAALRAMLDEITDGQVEAEGMSGAARNSLDMSRLGQAAFLMENVKDIPNASSHLTADDLMGVLTGLYQWRDYNSSPIAGTDPVLAVIRDALPERTGSAQWPLRVAARPVQMLCDALFGQRAENVNLAKTLGPQLFGSYKYEDGWYYFASMTVPSASVSYADPSPLPHLQDNAYRFFSSSEDRSDDRLYQMEIRPTLTSPFGFTVSSVVTIAEGREARSEAERVIQPPAAPPVPSAAVSQAPTPEPEELATEQAPPEFDYAPEGSLTGGMVFPDSDMRYLTDSDLASVANTYSDVPAALDLARNEIYARRGHIFSDPAYQNYFAQFAWYSPSHAVSEGEFNEFELQNLQQIASWSSSA